MRGRSIMTLALGVLAAHVCSGAAAEPPDNPPNLAFVPGDAPGQFRFDTGELRGEMYAGTRSLGLLPVVHVPTGTPLASSYGLVNYYRVFKTDHRFVESMRELPSASRILSDGALEVHWPANDERPFALTGVYRWTAPNILDIETTVTAKTELPDFEVFLSSYLTEQQPISHVYVKETPDGRENAFMGAREDYGVWQVYPRDTEALAIVEDGRWTKPPSPVDWAVMPDIAAPLVYRRSVSADVTVVTMAPPDDAFAVFSSCEGETHFSMYFGLYGQALAEGETAKVASRLQVITDAADADIVEAYRAYLEAGQKEERQ